MMSKTKFMSEVRRCLLNSMAYDACRGNYVDTFPGFAGISVWEMMVEDFDTDDFSDESPEYWNAAYSYCEDYLNECFENDDQMLWAAYKANVIDQYEYFAYVSDVKEITSIKFTQKEYTDLKKSAKTYWPRGCCTQNKLKFIYETGYYDGFRKPSLIFDCYEEFKNELEEYHI